MKNLWQNSQNKETARFVWMEGAERLDLLVKPDSSNPDLKNVHNASNTASSVPLETANISARISGVMSGQVAATGLAQERIGHQRSLENPTGVGAAFERKWINPVFWLKLILDSKGSILKNIANAAPAMMEMLGGSAMISTGVKSALYNKTHKDTLNAISSGGETSTLKNASLSTFKLLRPGVEEIFSGVLSDTKIEEILGQNTLKNRELFKKWKDLSLFRESRHKGMAQVIKHHVEKAYKEVAVNLDRVEKELRNNLTDTIAKSDNYRTGLELKNDSKGEVKFMDFVQKTIQNPDEFVTSGMTTLDLKEIFGTDNRVKILDALMLRYGDQVITLENSQQLTLDQDVRLGNMDKREVMTSQALNETDFNSLYVALGKVGVQPLDKDEILEDKVALAVCETGLRRIGINVQKDVYQDIPVEITTSEKLTLLLQYMAENQDVLNIQRCSIEFKQVLYTWMQRTHDTEEELLTQGATTESGTPTQRRYVLKNALVIKDAANDAIDALEGVDKALRSKDPTELNEKLQTLESFLTAYNKFYADSGAGSLIEKTLDSEKALLEGVTQFAGLNDEMQKIHDSLTEQRKEYYETVLLRLPEDEDELTRGLDKADRAMESLMKNLANKEGTSGIVVGQDDAVAVEKGRETIYKEVISWRDALQDQKVKQFKLPPKKSTFTGDRMIGAGLQHALDAIPENSHEVMEASHAHGFNGLIRQRMQKHLQSEREEEFNAALKANMGNQMDTLLGRNSKGEVTKVPEAGTSLEKLELAEVTNTSAEVVFPDSLENLDVLTNLKLMRSAQQLRGETKETQYVASVDMLFQNDTHIVGIREDNEGRVIAEVWGKPKDSHGNLNENVGTAHTQKRTFRVLNLSTGGTRKAEQKHAGLRRV